MSQCKLTLTFEFLVIFNLQLEFIELLIFVWSVINYIYVIIRLKLHTK